MGVSDGLESKIFLGDHKIELWISADADQYISGEHPRPLVLLLAALASILVPAALGTVTALGALAFEAQSRAGASKPATHIHTRVRVSETPAHAEIQTPQTAGLRRDTLLETRRQQSLMRQLISGRILQRR